MKNLINKEGDKMKTYYLVVQEGGTEAEQYATLYSTDREAQAAIKRHNRASYNACGPFCVPLDINDCIKVVDFLDIISAVKGAA